MSGRPETGPGGEDPEGRLGHQAGGGLYICTACVLAGLQNISVHYCRQYAAFLAFLIKFAGYCQARVMLIFEDVIFPLWNHLFLCYPCHADFKTALVFKIGPILVVDVNF